MQIIFCTPPSIQSSQASGNELIFHFVCKMWTDPDRKSSHLCFVCLAWLMTHFQSDWRNGINVGGVENHLYFDLCKLAKLLCISIFLGETPPSQHLFTPPASCCVHTSLLHAEAGAVAFYHWETLIQFDCRINSSMESSCFFDSKLDMLLWLALQTHKAWLFKLLENGLKWLQRPQNTNIPSCS